jgi:hypothetical protein
MKRLETSRVCVIDDEVEEYLPLIHALSHLRMGCIHVAGDKHEDLPKEPLRGLRLVFLDMQLASEANDEATTTAHTAHVFSRVVPPDAGPLLVVIWTKYKDYADPFRARLYEAHPEYRGKLLFAMIEKPVGETPAQADELQEKVSAVMKDFYPAELLWRWEQLVHDAASDTTEGISKRAAERAKFDAGDSEETSTAELKKGLLDVLRILISAEAEQTISAETAFRDLLGVLNPLQYDRLEHGIDADDTKAGQNLVGGNEVSPTPDEKLELNTMLLVAPYVAGGPLFRPGVIFGIDDHSAFETRFKILIEEVFSEVLDARSSELNKFQKKLAREDLTEKRRKELEPRLEEEETKVREARAAWFAKCVPILLDISPLCDFAQGNERLARLMAGLMVPDGAGIKCHFTGAFHKLTTVKIPDNGDGGWNLVFCSRFVFTVPPKATAEEVRPICRLRDSIVADLRGWAAAQDARAGHVSVK